MDMWNSVSRVNRKKCDNDATMFEGCFACCKEVDGRTSDETGAVRQPEGIGSKRRGDCSDG